MQRARHLAASIGGLLPADQAKMKEGGAALVTTPRARGVVLRPAPMGKEQGSAACATTRPANVGCHRQIQVGRTAGNALATTSAAKARCHQPDGLERVKASPPAATAPQAQARWDPAPIPRKDEVATSTTAATSPERVSAQETVAAGCGEICANDVQRYCRNCPR